ncbi:hypothetical protein ACWEIJ_08435 [Lentzea sp. NPDC004789]
MAATVFVGGCTSKPVETPTFSDVPTTTSSPAPVKYHQAALKSCSEIGQETGDLPPAQPNDDQKLGSNSSARTCRFRGADHSVTLSIRSWDDTEDIRGARPAAEYAKDYFADRTQAWEKDIGANLGSDARWRTKSPAACALEILDQNGVLTVANSSNSSTGFDEQQCRTTVRELAKKFFGAVQP